MKNKTTSEIPPCFGRRRDLTGKDRSVDILGVLSACSWNGVKLGATQLLVTLEASGS